MYELMLRLVRTWALNNVAHTKALSQFAPTWGSEVHAVGDGWLILSGRGMYVNRAMAVGIDAPASNDDIELVVSRSRSVGVQPAIEVTPLTVGATLERLTLAGFVHDAAADVTALVRPVPGVPIDAPDDIVVRPVLGEDELRVWQQTSAIGWSHVDAQARAVSDAFTSAAYVGDQDGMAIAFDRAAGNPVGCASVTIRDGLATLGGMSTHPNHRRRGVQAALIRHRLEFAAQRGCDQAATTAAANGASQRNLRRHGFTALFDVATWRL